MYSGILGGSTSANSSPVSAALPSDIVDGFPQIMQKAYSDTTAVKTEMRITRAECIPCDQIPRSDVGTSAQITMYMILFVVSGPLV